MYLRQDEEEIARYFEEEDDWTARSAPSSLREPKRGSILWSDFLEMLRKPIHLGHSRPHVPRGV